jgi:predicted membrane protein
MQIQSKHMTGRDDILLQLILLNIYICLWNCLTKIKNKGLFCTSQACILLAMQMLNKQVVYGILFWYIFIHSSSLKAKKEEKLKNNRYNSVSIPGTPVVLFDQCVYEQ